MNRRRFLELAAISTPVIAGCSGQGGDSGPTSTDSPSSTPTRTQTATPPSTSTRSPTDTPTETRTPTETPRENPDAIFVGPNGNDGNDGSRNSPLETIQQALSKAQPGNTVRVLPGEYYEDIVTVRSGEDGNPITITGPAEAVIRGERGDYSIGADVRHSHIHIEGMTFNGLQIKWAPDSADSYMNSAMRTLPVDHEYLEDIVFKPHAAGNTRGALINLSYVENVEIGEFKLIGPAGLDYKLGEKTGHYAEVVYIGSPIGSEWSAWDLVGIGEIGEVDKTKNVHVHHIDASEGYYHVELADVKAGCQHVTVEYCSSRNARLPNDNDNSAAVHLGGTDGTFRWNRIESPAHHGITVGNYGPYNEDIPHPDAPEAGTDNEIYGNKILDSGEFAIRYTGEVSEDAQRFICGNSVNTAAEGNPARTCSSDVPEGDGNGHLGGDSPWA